MFIRYRLCLLSSWYWYILLHFPTVVLQALTTLVVLIVWPILGFWVALQLRRRQMKVIPLQSVAAATAFLLNMAAVPISMLCGSGGSRYHFDSVPTQTRVDDPDNGQLCSRDAILRRISAARKSVLMLLLIFAILLVGAVLVHVELFRRIHGYFVSGIIGLEPPFPPRDSPYNHFDYFESNSMSVNSTFMINVMHALVALSVVQWNPWSSTSDIAFTGDVTKVFASDAHAETSMNANIHPAYTQQMLATTTSSLQQLYLLPCLYAPYFASPEQWARVLGIAVRQCLAKPRPPAAVAPNDVLLWIAAVSRPVLLSDLSYCMQQLLLHAQLRRDVAIDRPPSEPHTCAVPAMASTVPSFSARTVRSPSDLTPTDHASQERPTAAMAEEHERFGDMIRNWG